MSKKSKIITWNITTATVYLWHHSYNKIISKCLVFFQAAMQPRNTIHLI